MSHTQKSAAIIHPSTGPGLQNDAALLASALERHGVVTTLRPRSRKMEILTEVRLSRKARRLGSETLIRALINSAQRGMRSFGPQRRTIQFFIEFIPAARLFTGGPNVFLPHPEWLLDLDEWKLPFIDIVACKTRHAEEMFSAAGYKTFQLGFTSKDRGAVSATPSRNSWLHVASQHTQKGTDVVVEAWRQHPAWPHITVLAGKNPAIRQVPSTANMTIVTDWVSEDALAALMQRCGVHLCPSLAEGYGHSIAEGMSCGALVITTELPPMSELVAEDRGMLVRPSATSRMSWATSAVLTPDDIAHVVDRALQLSDLDYAARCRSAREWFISNDALFHERLLDLLELA